MMYKDTDLTECGMCYYKDDYGGGISIDIVCQLFGVNLVDKKRCSECLEKYPNNAMYGFRRNTHMGKQPRFLSEENHKVWSQLCGFVGHMLDPGKVMSFQDLIQQVHKYNMQEEEELMSSEDIALELILLIENDMVSVERIK